MGKSKIDRSPNRDHYIQLKRDGLSFHKLAKEAARLGEDISHQAFYRYFKKHRIVVYLDKQVQKYLNAIRDNGLEALETQKESIDVIDRIKRNLITLEALTAALVTSNPSSPSQINACTNLLKETRLTLGYLDNKRKEMMAETDQSAEMGIGTLLKLLSELPSECPKCGIDLDIIARIQKKLAQ